MTERLAISCLIGYIVGLLLGKWLWRRTPQCEHIATIARAEKAERSVVELREALLDLLEAANLVTADAGIMVTWPVSAAEAIRNTTSMQSATPAEPDAYPDTTGQ